MHFNVPPPIEQPESSPEPPPDFSAYPEPEPDTPPEEEYRKKPNGGVATDCLVPDLETYREPVVVAEPPEELPDDPDPADDPGGTPPELEAAPERSGESPTPDTPTAPSDSGAGLPPPPPPGETGASSPEDEPDPYEQVLSRLEAGGPDVPAEQHLVQALSEVPPEALPEVLDELTQLLEFPLVDRKSYAGTHRDELLETTETLTYYIDRDSNLPAPDTSRAEYGYTVIEAPPGYPDDPAARNLIEAGRESRRALTPESKQIATALDRTATSVAQLAAAQEEMRAWANEKRVDPDAPYTPPDQATMDNTLSDISFINAAVHGGIDTDTPVGITADRMVRDGARRLAEADPAAITAAVLGKLTPFTQMGLSSPLVEGLRESVAIQRAYVEAQAQTPEERARAITEAIQNPQPQPGYTAPLPSLPTAWAGCPTFDDNAHRVEEAFLSTLFPGDAIPIYSSNVTHDTNRATIAARDNVQYAARYALINHTDTLEQALAPPPEAEA